jgi:hypothetical protein
MVKTRAETPRVTRIVAAFLLPFLLAAGVLLYLWPDRTAELFAWSINPPFTALLMGAGYLSGLYFFARVAAGARWPAVRLGFLPIAVFAWLLGGATLLHLDRFHPGHISFIAWASLYALTPFVVPLLWWLGRKVVADTTSGDTVLPRGIAWLVGIAGAGLLMAGLAMWVVPAAVMPAWPWMLTPLTARVVGSFFALTGLVDISIARHRQWRDVRIVAQTQIIGLALILLGIPRALPDMHWANPLSVGFVALIALLCAGMLALYAFMERRAHVAPASAQA